MKYLSRVLKVVLAVLVILASIIILLFGHRDIPLEELKKKYTNESSSFVDLEGIQVHFRDEGDKSDTNPIILIHGTGSSLQTFEEWVNVLKKNHRVISIDLPGYGLTGQFLDSDYSIPNYVYFIKKFLSALDIEKCILAGNSLGGRIAWNFTLQHPEVVDKLILIDASGYPVRAKSTPMAFKLAKVPVLNKVFTFITPKFIVKKSVTNVYADKTKVTDELVDRYFEMTLREGNRQAFVDRFAVAKDNTTYKDIPSIVQPTLILWGKEDQLIPVSVAYKFHEDLQNDTLVILEGLGHVPMEEDPERSIQPLLDFLESNDFDN